MYEADLNDDVKALHSSRIMFAIVNENLKISKNCDTRGHKEWFKDEGFLNIQPFDSIIRGYVDETGIYMYVGENFITNIQYEQTFLTYIKDICSLLHLSYNLSVFAGMHIGKKGEKWYPIKTLGKIQDLI